MTEEFKKQIETEARQAVTELLAQAKLKKGDVFVVGCSSSEIVGGHIGKDSSLEAAQAVYAGVAPVLAENGIWLAAQCCEHLNRAIIIEREAAEKYGWEEVCVVPRPHAGGSWATTCWKQFKDPIAVEEIRAHAGIDIGGTLIGMHLRRVAVPVRLSLSKIGEANILCARTRPKLIGGGELLSPLIHQSVNALGLRFCLLHQLGQQLLDKPLVVAGGCGAGFFDEIVLR